MSIEIAGQKNPPDFVNVRKAASLWNTLLDPQDIQDTEAPDVLNMVFDKGYPTPRAGSSLAWTKPSGETNDLLNLINSVTSDRVEYAIAIYAPNIYLRDETNNVWIKINGAYTPSSANKTLTYGYALWNRGVGSDALYFGNGTDDTIKWSMALCHLTTAAASADTTLTVDSTRRFPSSGTVVVKGDSGEFTLTYTSKSATTFTLSGTVGQDVSNGAGVAMAIQDMSSMPKGKLFTTYQERLIIGNFPGGEATLYYSVTDNAEDFTAGSAPNSGGFIAVVQGIGEITGLMGFGLYLGVLKGDSFYRIDFNVDATNSTMIVQATPLVSDNAMGCPFPRGWVKKNNVLYYPSAVAGFFSVSPIVTGYQTSIQLAILSQNITPTYQSLNFDNTKSTAFQTKIFWTAATSTATDTIMVYDTLRQYWTRFNNWPVKDWLSRKDNLYFGSLQDGNIYKCLDGQTDNNSPYESYVYTKRYDFGAPSLPKTATRLFIQGYMPTSTKLYCDVLYNEGGTLQTLTYVIDGTQPYVIQPITQAMAMVMMGVPVLGGSQPTDGNVGIFKVYLALPVRLGFFNIQVKFYTSTAGNTWSVTGIGINPVKEVKSPEDIVIGVSGITPIPSPVVPSQS